MKGNRKSSEKKISSAETLSGFTVLIAVCVFVLLIYKPVGAQTAQDIIAPEGCAMAHCDQAMSDNVRMPALSRQAVLAWRDTTVYGSLLGMGCSSNSRTVVCSFRSTARKPAEIRAYNPDGTTLWSSSAFSTNAYYSAPMISPDGGVVAADESRIIRFNSQGQTLWSRETAGGFPISPNVTDDGVIVLGTKLGPISAYDYTTGNMLAQLWLNETIQYNGTSYDGFFDTINTPAIRGNRLYIATQFKYNSGQNSLPLGRMFAIDLVRDGQGVYGFIPAWHFEFRAPSGSSPTLRVDQAGSTLIFFDGAGLDPSGVHDPRIFGMRDLGTSGQFLWTYQMPTIPQMSPALDPRGGVWYFARNAVRMFRFSEESGQILQTININTIINDSPYRYMLASVMTISGEENAQVMMVAGTTQDFSRTFVTAIDLNSGTALWKYRVDEGRGFYGMPSGQYPILINSSNQPVVVFSTRGNGVRALVAQP